MAIPFIEYEDLLKEWDYDKNNLNPKDLIDGYTNKKVWWKCSKGHSYQTLIRSRIIGCGCPICSNRIILKGYNDFATTHPHLLKFWNYEKNIIFPSQVSYGSTKKVWWKCSKGHEFESPINRISNGGKCPYCTNEKVLKGYNDLQSNFPEIIEYWDFEKNNVSPDEISPHSNKKAWFKCNKGHSYNVVINSKTRGNIHSCPICNTYKRTSVPEKIIFYYAKKVFNDVLENYKPDWLKPKEIDVYIPSLKMGIEYDGYKYHDDICIDFKKDELCRKNGIKLIRIRELECPSYESSAIFFNIALHYKNNFLHVEQVLKDVFDYLEVEIDIDIQRDYADIMSLVNIGNKENCLAVTNPELLKEWDYEKNQLMNVDPYSVTKGSAIKVWWKCSKGHLYQCAVNKKALRKDKCPYCANKKILEGYNDLATTHPKLLKEWNYNKNFGISPNNVFRGSLKKVWWICSKCGNEWEAIIGNRSRGSGCPKCHNKILDNN